MEKKYNLVYCTINLFNWKMYIGDHSSNNINFYKSKNYIGSGNLIKQAIKKHGKNNFIRINLEFFNTKKEAFDAQEKYIKLLNTISPNGYNISLKGGHNVKNSFSYESLEKLKNSHKGKSTYFRTEEHKRKMSEFFKGYKHTEETKRKMSERQKGKKLSEETKRKISKSQLGMYRSEEAKRRMKLAQQNRNYKASDKTKQKIRMAHLGKKASDELKQKMSIAQKNRWKNYRLNKRQNNSNVVVIIK